MKKSLLTLAVILCCTITIGAQSSSVKTKMSPWLQAKYQQHQTNVKKNGGQLRVKGHPVRNYMLALVESSDDAKTIRQKGGVVWQDFGDGICAAFLPMDSLDVLCRSSRILRMEANAPSNIQNDTSAVILNVDKAWDFEKTVNSQLLTLNSSIPQAFTGKGVIAAIMDVGFDFTHPAFRNDDGTSRFQWFWDPLAKNEDPDQLGQIYASPEQILAVQHSSDAKIENHGSHVTGSVTGRGLNGRYVGMAPEADIMGGVVPLGPLQTDEFLDQLKEYLKTHANEIADIHSDIIKVEISSTTELVMLYKIFEQATAAGKPCVVNWSFGSGFFFDIDYTLFEIVFNRLIGPGRIVVASAGNEGGDMVYIKKNADEVLDHPMYCYDLNNEQTLLNIRPADINAPFVLGLTFDNMEDTLYIDTRDVIEIYSEDTTYTTHIKFLADDNPFITSPKSAFCKVTMTPQEFAYGRLGYVLSIATPISYQGPSTFTIHLIIKDPVELEFTENVETSGDIRFSTNNATNSRGCNMYTIGYPGGLERIITVGAMHHRTSFTNILGEPNTAYPAASQEGLLASFSSCGPTAQGLIKPDVVAPGHNIMSVSNSFYAEGNEETIKEDVIPYTCYKANVFGKEYGILGMCGTSMSSPITTGVIALWLQANPNLTPEDIKGVIERTSHQPEPEFSGSDKNIYYGWGEIDAYAGLLDILGLGTSIPSLSKHQPAGIAFRIVGSTLYVDGLEGEADITLYDLSGRPVLKTVVANGSVNLSDLTTGIYAVQLDQRGSTLIRL